MKEHLQVLTTLLLAMILNTGFSQSSEIRIRFIGNCGLHMTDGNINIYSDFPYKSGVYNYMEYDLTELDSIKENPIFLFTHKHADHYSRKDLKKVMKARNGKKYGTWNVSDLEDLNEAYSDFHIQAIKTKHRFTFKHYSYLITWHGKRIFISGDTESAETIGKVKNIDWAFVPYWILYDAKENNIEIDAKMRALYHLAPVQKLPGEIPEDLVVLQEPNIMIRIPYETKAD